MQTTTKTFLQQVISEAKSNVRNEMILHSFIKAESIELTKEVYDSRIDALVEEYAVKDAKELEKNYGKEMIENTMLYDIMIEKLLEYSVEVE
jgi:FKBP-type peptidyl-prolyl cis-trans isomerase (trigger factor)